MIAWRYPLLGIHPGWKVSSITKVLLGTPKKKSITSSRLPKSLWPNPKEDMASQRATDREYSSKIVTGDMKAQEDSRYQVLSVHECSSSLASDVAGHTEDSVGSSTSLLYSSNETEAVIRCESSSVEVNYASVSEVEKHAVSIEVDAALIRFVKGKGGATQHQIEQEMGVNIVLPSVGRKSTVVIEGSSIESVNEAATKVKVAVDEGIRSRFLDYSHFVSLPLAIHPELVEKLNDFQNSILGEDHVYDTRFQDVETSLEMNTDKRRSNSSASSELGIDRSIFINPKTFHLTVLMLKLWNEERVTAAAEVLQKISPKVLEALDNRPLSIRLNGLECMKGSRARARVLYAPVEEIGGEGRLMRACEIIINAYAEAGLVLENSQQSLKLHATLMNARHRKRSKTSRMRVDSFDAREIFKKYGTENWGEYLIREAHLSQRFLFCENGYYHCCASLPFPAM